MKMTGAVPFTIRKPLRCADYLQVPGAICST